MDFVRTISLRRQVEKGSLTLVTSVGSPEVISSLGLYFWSGCSDGGVLLTECVTIVFNFNFSVLVVYWEWLQGHLGSVM
jgi:hypothetical protein